MLVVKMYKLHLQSMHKDPADLWLSIKLSKDIFASIQPKNVMRYVNFKFFCGLKRRWSYHKYRDHAN